MKEKIKLILGFILLGLMYVVYVNDRIICAPLGKTSVSFGTWIEVDKWQVYGVIRVLVFLGLVMILTKC